MTRSDTDIGQSIEQSNDCGGSTTCTNEGRNEANCIWILVIQETTNLISSLDIYQSIEQSKACSGLLHAVIQQVT